MFSAITGGNEECPTLTIVRIQQPMRRTWQEIFEDEAANHIIRLHSVGANF
jgi:hypothetical protein